MTYRINTRHHDEEIHLFFEGLLDRAAMDDVLAQIAAARSGSNREARLVLGVGSSIEGDVIPRLRTVHALTVTTVSSFLAHWLRQQGVRVEP